MKYAVSSRLAIQASSIHAPYSDAPLPGKDMNDKVVHTLNKSCTVESVQGFLSELAMKPHNLTYLINEYTHNAIAILSSYQSEELNIAIVKQVYSYIRYLRVPYSLHYNQDDKN